MSIEIKVPATIANLGPGFDTCGLAVDLFNTFTFTESETDQIIADTDSTQGISKLPTNPAQNIIFPAMDRLFKETGETRPKVTVTIKIDVPVARGLGSSSTAVVSGLQAANQLSKNPLDETKLLKIATELEGHPDNVTPAILGGMVVSDNEHFARLDWPDDWKVLTLIPDYEVMTAKARTLVPDNYTQEDVVFNLRKVALLTASVSQHNEDLFVAALQDRVHQPYRKQLIPEFDEVSRIATQFEALGTIISGSGSTMAIFCHKNKLSELKLAFEAFCDSQYPGWEIKTLSVFQKVAQTV